MNERILVTGAAGFIGMHVAMALLDRGHRVVGVDNLNDYYPVSLKKARLGEITRHPQAAHFKFARADIADQDRMLELHREHDFTRIVHLAAQAGVRYSIENPLAYARSNLVGMTVILELARRAQVSHMVYASSSSVYGGNSKVPYSETDRVDSPVSFYAATKLANEAMAHSYSHLYRLPLTGLRFFTVYGPWGRPDMAPWLFTEAIAAGRPIKVFGHGKPRRDFTYIDDIVRGVVDVLDLPPPATVDGDPHRVLNIGNNEPVSVDDFIATIECTLGRRAERIPMAMQPGDVEITFADVSRLQALTDFRPNTALADGMAKFAAWYLNYADSDSNSD
ncbi:MAG: GDP-mannose 4,6-dehydratase [Burkholderiaceae bacterium]